MVVLNSIVIVGNGGLALELIEQVITIIFI